ncbi:unnamed protein product [Acanthoscelides obtectus]|uniref:Uncharacterized protein n=1 Tax=Acanthoscelides obtectus TaxID=200917 RepID=A0A9P0Q6H6_ACAOB|nr:unnamed protein product [Acanthoscelides obtectus]CAK1675498.1 hypothetical protein AOBTE_LOCUS30261 [Acanthoscelides obtectus]
MLCIHKSSKPYVCRYCKSFHQTKMDLEAHYVACKHYAEPKMPDVKLNDKVLETPMPVEKMRFLLAILLKKISVPERLQELGFDKKLIDDVLIESIKNSGREPCTNSELSVGERLKKNVTILLEWTVPKSYMESSSWNVVQQKSCWKN